MILTEGDIDVLRHKEMLKSIKHGGWPEQKVHDFFAQKEKDLEKVYAESKLPWGPNEEAIKELLLNCLEHHFGSLDKAVIVPNKLENALRQIKEICDNVGV